MQPEAYPVNHIEYIPQKPLAVEHVEFFQQPPLAVDHEQINYIP
jgi:hypothetical protein